MEMRMPLDRLFTTPEELDELIDLVHDQLFDLDDFVAQIGDTRVLDVRPTSKDFRKNRIVDQSFLTIFNIAELDIVDTERIGCYDFNVISYENGWLTIHTEVPLRFRIRVTALRLRYEVRSSDA